MVKEEEPLGVWTDNLDDGCTILRVLIDIDRIESLTDRLTQKFSSAEGFRITLFAVGATLPQPDVEEEEEKKDQESQEQMPERISREELYSDVTSGSEFSWVYITMIFLSTVVAAVGLVYDDVIAIIGAMVIAPLMGPNVALALAITLADEKLVWRSVKTNIGGLFQVF